MAASLWILDTISVHVLLSLNQKWQCVHQCLACAGVQGSNGAREAGTRLPAAGRVSHGKAAAVWCGNIGGQYPKILIGPKRRRSSSHVASYCSSSAPPRRRAFHHRCCLSSSSPHSLSPLSILPLCPYLLSEPSNKILLCYIFSTQRRRIDPAPCILVLGHSQRRSAAGEKMHENAATPPMVRPSWTYPFSPLSSFSLLYGAVFAPFLLHRCRSP